MKRVLKIFKGEFSYLVYSKAFYIFTIGILLIALANIWGNINAVDASQQDFERTKQNYISSNMDWEKALKSELNIVETKDPDGTITRGIDNPIKYDLIEASKFLLVISNQYFSISILEVLTFLIGPLIFSIFGVWFATYEYRSRTVKLKAIQNSWHKNILTKQLTILALACVLVLSIYLITNIAGRFIYNAVTKDINNLALFIEQINYVPRSPVWVKILVSILVAYLFLMIGFTLGVIFKKLLTPVVLVLVYNILVPSLGKYDLKNLVSIIGNRTYEFQGIFKMFSPIPTSFTLAIMILSAIVVILFMLNLIIAKKQSKYIV